MMRIKYLLLLLGFILIIVVPLEAQTSSGVVFQKISFQKAKEEAKLQHKYIFMNVYALWCIPCKKLQRTTFQEEQVGRIFNKNFLNLSIDAENGEGISIAKKYQVKAHPYMLLLDANGNVQKRIIGYKTASQLLKELMPFIKE